MTRLSRFSAFLGVLALPMGIPAATIQISHLFDPTTPQLGSIDWQFVPLSQFVGQIDPSRISAITVTIRGNQTQAPDLVLMSNIVNIPGIWRPWIGVGNLDREGWSDYTIALSEKQRAIFRDNVLDGLVMRIDVFGEEDPLYLSYARLDVTIDEPLVDVTGSVALNDWFVSPSGMPVVLDLAKDGEIVASIPAVLDEKGTYLCQTSLRGVFDAYMKAPHWLRKLNPMPVTIGDNGVSGVDFRLPNGDIDGDNEIGIGDYARLSAAFNALPEDANWDEMADLNGDRSVDIGDYSVMSLLYGQFGD